MWRSARVRLMEESVLLVLVLYIGMDWIEGIWIGSETNYNVIQLCTEYVCGANNLFLLKLLKPVGV